MDELPRKRRKRGTGSVRYLAASRRWQGRYTDLDGKYHSVYGRTQAQAQAKVDASILLLPRRQPFPRPAPTASQYRFERRRAIVAELLAEGRVRGWDDDELAKVIGAQLAPARLARGIFGPCVYCGTWIADEVEHRIPRSRGGGDEADNLVSSCHPCNHEKATLTDEEYRRVRFQEAS